MYWKENLLEQQFILIKNELMLLAMGDNEYERRPVARPYLHVRRNNLFEGQYQKDLFNTTLIISHRP